MMRRRTRGRRRVEAEWEEGAQEDVVHRGGGWVWKKVVAAAAVAVAVMVVVVVGVGEVEGLRKGEVRGAEVGGRGRGRAFMCFPCG